MLLPGVPWSRELAEYFSFADLSGLFRDEPDSAALRRMFYRQVGDELSQYCFARLRAWCSRHGMFSSGHLLWEEETYTHTPLYGNFLRCLLELDIPGIDVLTASPQPGYRYNRRAAMLAASAAMLNGTRRIFSESSDFLEQLNENRVATVPEATATLAWQAALGITDFTYYFSYGLCHELSETTFNFMPPEQQQRYRTPEEFLAINTAVTELIGRLGSASLHADVFLYYPVELMQAAYCPVQRPWEAETRATELVHISESYHTALTQLLDAGIIPCLVDGDMLGMMRQTESGRYAVLQATAAAVVYPDGCQPPDDCLPDTPLELLPMTADLSRQLYDRGLARIYKTNPDICAGVMTHGEHTLITLVNLTEREQVCALHVQSGERSERLGTYEVRVLEV